MTLGVRFADAYEFPESTYRGAQQHHVVRVANVVKANIINMASNMAAAKRDNKLKKLSLRYELSAPAIGIDLGTTFSCVAVCRDGKVDVIPNAGRRITPSYVAYTETGTLVGAPAKDQEILNPVNTVFEAKRLIGRRWNDSTVESDRPHWPFTLVEKEGRPMVKVTHKGLPKLLYPEQISAEVLGAMRDAAQEYLKKPVKSAVITVPAHFNDAQRRATKDAATIAGLEVLRIINEPTAAALAFGLAEKTAEERKVVIFDFGGGTFDVSVLAIEEGIFEILATAGDTHLGGSDIDARLVDHFAGEFAKKYRADIRKLPRALRRLRTACEKAKCTLSTEDKATIKIDSLHADTDFHATITREEFEKLCSDLFRETLEPLKQAMKDADLKPSEIDEVVLVGGSTRIPAVRRLVQDFFNGKKLNESVNPDEAVACGAAVQAAILDGDESQLTKDIVLVDVTPLSLGKTIREDTMSVIIERNTIIPTKKTKKYCTLYDYQTSVKIEVLEGERPISKDNNLLGTFFLNNLTPAPRGVTKFDVTMELDADGILHVTAEETTTGNKKEITITNDRDRLTPDQIERMIQEAEKHKSEDQLRKAAASAKHKLEDYCLDMRGKAESYRLSNSDRQTILSECNATLEWLKETQAKKEDYERKQNELKLVFDLILNL